LPFRSRRQRRGESGRQNRVAIAEVKRLRSAHSSSSSTSFRRTPTFSNFVSFRRICDGFFTGNLVDVCDKNVCTLDCENFRDGFANAMSTASNDAILFWSRCIAQANSVPLLR